MNLSAHLKKGIATLTVATTLAIPSSAFAITTVSFTTPASLKVGLAPIAQSIISLAVKGSIILSAGNIVFNTGANTNGCLVHGLKATFCPAFSTYTPGNGTLTGAVVLTSPFNSTAATRGLRTGSGSVWGVQLDIRKNGKGLSYDCVVQHSGVTGTGSAKVTLFTDKTATGTYLYNTPFVMSQNDRAYCDTAGSPKSTDDVELRLITMDTQVGK